MVIISRLKKGQIDCSVYENRFIDSLKEKIISMRLTLPIERGKRKPNGHQES